MIVYYGPFITTYKNWCDSSRRNFLTLKSKVWYVNWLWIKGYFKLTVKYKFLLLLSWVSTSLRWENIRNYQLLAVVLLFIWWGLIYFKFARCSSSWLLMFLLDSLPIFAFMQILRDPLQNKINVRRNNPLAKKRKTLKLINVKNMVENVQFVRISK